MLKNTTFVLMLMVFSSGLKAQEDTLKNWQFKGLTSLTLSQAGFSEYWASGGENSFSGLSLVNLNATFKKDKLSWENTLDIAYGLTRQEEKDARKSEDKLEFSSKLGIKASEKLFYTGNLSFKTQLFKGYDYANNEADDKTLISDFLAPAYLLISAGIDYKHNSTFSLLISPLTGKITLVNDTALSVNYGLKKAKTSRIEMGGLLKAAFDKDIMENINLQSKLELFSNYFENPGKIDVNLEVLLSFKVNDYISAHINSQLIYDYDIKLGKEGEEKRDRIQFKEVFGIGFAYKF